MAFFSITSDPTTHHIAASPFIVTSLDATNTFVMSAGGIVFVTGTSDAVRLAGSGLQTAIINGDVRSTSAAAVQLTTSPGDITIGATGTVTSGNIGLNTTNTLVLNNAGFLGGTNAAIIAGGLFGSITNAGIIQSSGSQATIQFTGSATVPAQNTVFNSGLIQTTGSTAISNGLLSSALRVTNTGSIVGGINTLGSSDRVLNSGLIDGNILLGGGQDIYDGRGGGRVTGAIDLGFGNDTFLGSDIAHSISSSAGDDTFSFGAGNDTYVASTNDGNDTLDGSGGSDTYDASLLASAVVNLLLGTTSGLLGTDTISNFENATGSIGNDTLIGNAAANTLIGLIGADLIDGRGGGADKLDGGADNDTYLIDAGDVVIDSGGIDLVQSAAISLNLTTLAGGAIEDATLLGTAALNLTGNANGNVLIGNAGNNILTGLAGIDKLDGAAGNDTYVIDAADIITADASGIDTIKTDAKSLNLANIAAGKIENATLTGSGAFNLVGNAPANTLVGNSGANRLDGKEGADILSGGLGNDVFVFTTALNAAQNVDRITDFNVTNDIVFLENTGPGLFTGLANGALAAGFFKANATGTATDADDRIVYNTATGDLFFDSNGNGAGAAVKFATIANKAALTAADFFVI